MSQSRRAIYLPSLGTLLLSLLVGVFLFAKKRRAKSNSSGKVVSHSVETSPEDALAYWTADKQQAAKPAPMPVVDEHQQEKRPPHSSQPKQN